MESTRLVRCNPAFPVSDTDTFALSSFPFAILAGYTIRKTNRPPLASDSMPRAPPSALTPSPSQPLPPTTTTSTPSVPTPSSSSSTPPVFPALHLTPLNNTFVPKQISLDPPGQKVKIGRQTNAKTVPNGTNGYFDSKVLSRAHAEVWSEENKVSFSPWSVDSRDVS